MTDAVLDRLERLERQVDQLRSGTAPRPETPPPPPARERPARVVAAPEKVEGVPHSAPPEVPVSTADEVQRVDDAPAPNRDDLVAAWGDEILPGLRPKLRAIYQVGRFVAADDTGAVLALPNQAHLEHAEPLCAEISDALSRHFGRPVGVRLVTESSPEAEKVSERFIPRAAASARATAADNDVSNEEELVAETRAADDEEAPKDGGKLSGLDLAEDRLLEAFPGAEEVE